jgi:hypothetical protein
MSAEIIQFEGPRSGAPEPLRSRECLNASNADKLGTFDIYPWPWVVLDGLPFVDPPAPQRADGELGKRNCWVDKPTENGAEDHARRRHYAKMMLSAMLANVSAFGSNEKLAMSVSAKALRDVLESMVCDAVARHKKGGKYSRTIITSAMGGFLFELTQHIAGLKE